MSRTLVGDVVFGLAGLGSIAAAWRVFRTDSMVRAAYWLLLSFVGVAVILVLLSSAFLGLVLMLMMGGEMTIMAVFMVMFMMNPAGLNPMTMVHQHRAAITAGVISFLALAGVGVFADFPDRPAPRGSQPTAELGRELLGNSMLIFETAGVTLLATMIGSIALAANRGRFGDAYATSLPPAMELEVVAAAPDSALPRRDEAAGDDPHAGMNHG